MISKVTNTINDSKNGIGTGTGTGLTAKIGVSDVLSSKPVLIRRSMDADKIREKLGNTPLTDACLDAIENGASTIYCLPVKASIAGVISEIDHEGTGKATVQASGKPTNSFDVVIKIETDGGTNEATVVISKDGGMTWTDEETIPLTGSMTVEDTGIELKFTAEDSSFVKGDTYSFKTEPPAASNEDIIKAVNVFRNYPVNIEMIHIVGTTTSALWVSLETLMSDWETLYGRPIFLLCEQRRPEADETAEVYFKAIEKDAQNVKGRHVAVCSQWAVYERSDGREQEINMAGCISGWIASTKESTSIAFVRDYSFSTSKVKRLLPEGIEDFMNEMDAARYIFLRTYNGLDGYYVASANMTAPETSQFSNVESVRVMYRIARAVYQRSLLHQNEDFDQSKPEVAYAQLQADLNVPIDDAIRDAIISMGEVIVLSEEINEGEDKKVPVQIRYVPRGYYREISLNFYVVNALS